MQADEELSNTFTDIIAIGAIEQITLTIFDVAHDGMYIAVRPAFSVSDEVHQGALIEAVEFQHGHRLQGQLCLPVIGRDGNDGFARQDADARRAQHPRPDG